jgi:hypothetical protein
MDKDKKNDHKVAHTYAEDMATVIEDDKGGLIKKIIHGEEQHELEKKNLSPESRKNRFFMLISFLLISVSLVMLAVFLLMNNSPTVPVQKQFIPLIFNDQNSFFEVKGLDAGQITQTIQNEVNSTQVKTGGIEGIYLTENKVIIGLREFITLTKSNFVPDSSNFISDNFLPGVVNGDTKDFFILLKTRSLPDIFNPLHNWESKMFSDLHGFFGINITADTNYLLTKNFEDGVIDNKNARILYDNNKNIVMMYIFADDNSVIITDTASAAQEIILRLSSSQIKQ